MTLAAEVGVFVTGILHYFGTTVQQPARCGTPHLALAGRPEVSDYTGVIRVSGRRTEAITTGTTIDALTSTSVQVLAV